MSDEKRKGIIHSTWFQITAALCIAVILYLFLAHIDLLLKGLGALVGFISPVIFGIIIAYVIDPLVKVFERYVFRKIESPGRKKRLSVTCAVASVIVLFAVLLIVLIPQLISNITSFIANIDTYTAQLQTLISDLVGKSAAKHIDLNNISNAVNDLLDKATSSISDNFDNIINTSVSVGKNIFNFVIDFILAIYFLLDKNRLIAGCKRLMRALLKENHYESTLGFLGRCNTILIRYIACDILDGIVIGVLNGIFMLIAGMPYVGLISIIVGVTNLAPTFGPIVGCVIGAFILLLTNPVYALVFIIFTICLQTFDGYIFKPKLFGGVLNVSSIWILVCIIVGGRIFGVWGILLAIPFAAISDFVYQETITVKLEERRRKKDAEEAEKGSGDKSVVEKIKEGFSEMTADSSDKTEDGGEKPESSESVPDPAGRTEGSGAGRPEADGTEH